MRKGTFPILEATNKTPVQGQNRVMAPSFTTATVLRIVLRENDCSLIQQESYRTIWANREQLPILVWTSPRYPYPNAVHCLIPALFKMFFWKGLITGNVKSKITSQSITFPLFHIHNTITKLSKLYSVISLHLTSTLTCSS